MLKSFDTKKNSLTMAEQLYKIYQWSGEHDICPMLQSLVRPLDFSNGLAIEDFMAVFLDRRGTFLLQGVLEKTFVGHLFGEHMEELKRTRCQNLPKVQEITFPKWFEDRGKVDKNPAFCKKDLEATTPDSYRRRTLGLRRRMYNSSESIESLFSYQFSQMITLARQTHSTVLEHDNQSIDGDGVARLVQLTNTRTTPSESRRWRRVFSDTESDGFDSFYGENESNVSFRRYRHFPGEDDTISYTTYGGDSDASIDEDFGLQRYQMKYGRVYFVRRLFEELVEYLD
ncbi:uncharacterized protein Fot_22921 [Forsythia ovata]|uniref:Uncharacterized protein n=1 Tax=Forsythia ovata TaxID=205694 RepID=A0ABD1UZ42_9LAMI